MDTKNTEVPFLKMFAKRTIPKASTTIGIRLTPYDKTILNKPVAVAELALNKRPANKENIKRTDKLNRIKITIFSLRPNSFRKKVDKRLPSIAIFPATA